MSKKTPFELRKLGYYLEGVCEDDGLTFRDFGNRCADLFQELREENDALKKRIIALEKKQKEGEP